MPPRRKPCETCALRSQVAGRLVARDEARRDAVGLGRARLRDELRAGVVVREDAVEDLLLVLARSCSSAGRR